MRLHDIYKSERQVERWVRGHTAHHRIPAQARYNPAHPGLVGVPLVMLRRMAALARDTGATMDDVIAVRDRELQARLYRQYVAGTGVLAAKPGMSWHGVTCHGREAACAIDTPSGSNPTWERLGRSWVMRVATMQAPYSAYGVCLPLTVPYVGRGKAEPWHWQPVETLGVASAKRDKWLHTDDAIYGYPATLRANSTGIWMDEFERLTGTRDIRAAQRVHRLRVDGIAGPITWAAVYGMEG